MELENIPEQAPQVWIPEGLTLCRARFSPACKVCGGSVRLCSDGERGWGGFPEDLGGSLGPGRDAAGS